MVEFGEQLRRAREGKGIPMIPIVGLLFAMRPLTLPMCFFAFNIYSHSVATNAKTRKL